LSSGPVFGPCPLRAGEATNLDQSAGLIGFDRRQHVNRSSRDD